MNIYDLGRVAAATGYVGFLVHRGLSAKARFASWHMFVTASRCSLELRARDESGEVRVVNPWDYLPHSFIQMNRNGLEFFLWFLREVRGVEAWGTARLRQPKGTELLEIRASTVLAE